MLPKINRLKRDKDFRIVFKNGNGFKSKYLYIKTVDNNLPFTRFGVIVSQKISREAVARNKIKRRIRIALNRILPHVKKSKDVVIIAVKGIDSKNFNEIYEETKILFEKAKLIKQQ